MKKLESLENPLFTKLEKEKMKQVFGGGVGMSKNWTLYMEGGVQKSKDDGDIDDTVHN